MRCRHILRDNNNIVDHIIKEVRGWMNQLVVLVDPSQNIRQISEENIQQELHS